jgi:hypothetical protein
MAQKALHQETKLMKNRISLQTLTIIVLVLTAIHSPA